MAAYRLGRSNTKDRPARRSEDIMQELRSQGSVQAVMEVHQDLFLYQAGVYTNTNTGPVLGQHAVRILGWGEEEGGTKYWRVANSWGQHWGERGTFRVARGQTGGGSDREHSLNLS